MTAAIAISIALTCVEATSAVTAVSGETGNHRTPPDKVPSETTQEWRTFEATAYIALCDTGCTGITATGLDVRQHITVDGRRVVATDPDVIAMGTTLTIRLADGTEIDAIALDTGGAIKGRKVDVLMANLHDAKQFGRQTVEVRIDGASGAE
ncbi:3D domain-containing protein [Paenibacillus campinasensis]|uniref:3D domain-containing protein n=1 Tax=Paenibacillus campinasensis TaxID=66347 RepID=UPI001FD42E39|nr:3D domain-containing protein [Paenibacillus campinasensis]